MVYTISEITDRLTPVFEQNGVTKAILFGSYAKGTATEESDVDIVVEMDKNERPIMFFGVFELAIESLGKPVDMIPYVDIIPNGRIDNEVSQNGKVIYERQ
jgi:predicted nucleotidyltransferase